MDLPEFLIETLFLFVESLWLAYVATAAGVSLLLVVVGVAGRQVAVRRLSAQILSRIAGLIPVLLFGVLSPLVLFYLAQTFSPGSDQPSAHWFCTASLFSATGFLLLIFWRIRLQGGDLSRESGLDNILAGTASVLLFTALPIFSGALALGLDENLWPAHSLAFPARGILLFLTLFAFAATLGGSALLYFLPQVLGLTDDDRKEISRLGNIAVFTGILLLPFQLSALLFASPERALTVPGFVFHILALFVLFGAFHMLHALHDGSTVGFHRTLPAVLAFALFLSLLSVESGRGLATRNYRKAVRLAEIGGSSEKNASAEKFALGEKVYKARCTVCHTFDKKLVGPPHKDVLPKYEGKLNELVAFIMNPVKIDPAFPPMAPLGLRKSEAEAVAAWAMREYKKIQE